jgi:hypothetical protein
MFSRNDQERLERKQERIDSGFVSMQFPGVAGIAVNMQYIQRGGITVDRVVHFYPTSYAFFRVTCLSQDCVNGGFDLTQIIHMMVRNHNEVSGHSNIAYEIAIRYA